MKMKKIITKICLSMLSALVIAIPIGGFASTTKSVSSYVGSPMMWSKNIVVFTYGKGFISSSYASQNAGAIFPCTITKNGIRRVSKSGSSHTYWGTYTGGGGIVTPWGSVNLISQTRTLQTIVYSNGSYSGRWIK